jgi:hypothetical protein
MLQALILGLCWSNNRYTRPKPYLIHQRDQGGIILVYSHQHRHHNPNPQRQISQQKGIINIPMITASSIYHLQLILHQTSAQSAVVASSVMVTTTTTIDYLPHRTHLHHFRLTHLALVPLLISSCSFGFYDKCLQCMLKGLRSAAVVDVVV